MHFLVGVLLLLLIYLLVILFVHFKEDIKEFIRFRGNRPVLPNVYWSNAAPSYPPVNSNVRLGAASNK
ncbi:hypothetical protein TYRP_013315 [Tyrophagus putrescentiae]|nr:hypothetical protein TYRP_013315 [Tyrophagus putrescentiae]